MTVTYVANLLQSWKGLQGAGALEAVSFYVSHLVKMVHQKKFCRCIGASCKAQMHAHYVLLSTRNHEHNN